MNNTAHIEVKFIFSKTISYFRTGNKYILTGNTYLPTVNSYFSSVFKKYIKISLFFHQHLFMFSSKCNDSL